MIIFHTNCMRWCNILYFMCYLWVNRRCLLFEVHFFVRSQRFFVPFLFFLAGMQCVFGLFTPNISDCMKNTLKPFPFHVLFSLSLLFFSFSTRQRVFFSRYNNTTMGFDGFALLLVYVCGSLVVSFPTFKQHQLKIFFSTVGIYISSKAFCIKTLH